MGIKRVLNSRVAAIGAGAAVLAVLAGGTGYAAGQIDSGDIKDNSIRGVDVKDGKLTLKDLSKGSLEDLAALAGQDGQDGKDGTDGQDATLAASSQGTATIANLGGSFLTNSTPVATLELDAGTYVINGYGFFDTVAGDSPRTDGTHLMLALRGPATEDDQFGEDLGTCFTGAFPQGDREATCQVTRTVTLEESTTVRVIAFGYNEDTSGTGGGSFTVATDVSAIQLAAPAAN